MKKSILVFFAIIISSFGVAQVFVNPIPERDIKRLEQREMRLYRRNKICDCSINRDSVSMIHIYWADYDTQGFISKDCFISLEFAKHIIPWYDHYGCRRLLRTYTILYNQSGFSVGFWNGWDLFCGRNKTKGDNIIDNELFYDEITKHGIKHIFQIYNLALGELIGVGENGEVFLISGFGSLGNHFKVAKIQNVPDAYWLELFDKPEHPATRKLLYEIEILEETNE